MRSARAGIAAATAAILAIALSVVGGAAAGAASPASGLSVTHLCSAARPGTRECFALRVTRRSGGSTSSSANPAAIPSGYGPADLRSAYNLPATGGSGVTVAIVDAFNDPTAEADLASYRATYGLPACTTANGCFKKVSQTGSTTALPRTDTGWSGEIALDIEMVSAACSSCQILLVEANSANNADLDTAVNYAAAHAQVVSNSYGGSESSSDTSDTSYNHAGVLILASSGDEGYVVEFPAASPTVLAVGGTALTHTASGSRAWTERVWNTSNSEGPGSGCSKFEPQPTWQMGNATIKAACARRAVADVSAVADPATGVAVYDTTGSTGWDVYGGTSVASPLVGAIFALTGHASVTPQYPYANTANFYDVTSGQTSSSCASVLCKAAAGWDGPTGIGTPNGTAMAASSTPANDFSVAVSPGSASVVAGSAASATVSTATTAGSAQAVALSVTGAPSGVTAALSPTSVTSGSSSGLTITTTSAVPAGSYPLTITATAASGSHSVTYTLTLTPGAGSCQASSQRLTNPGFESGSTGWTATAAVINTTASGAFQHSGTGYAWLDGYGTSHTDTLSQSVTIAASACTATLSFWLNITTAEVTTTTAYDKLTVSAGATVLATYSNLNKSSAYAQKSFNVAAFRGQTITLTFKGVEDSSLQTSFFIDDTALTLTS